MSRTLLLFPTALEANEVLECEFGPRAIVDLPGLPHEPKAALCGFGLPMAAALATAIMKEVRPQHVILMGIAGSYDLAQAPLGTVVEGTMATCHGVGAGQGEHHQDAAALGFDPHKVLGLDQSGFGLASLDPTLTAGGLVSVTAASASAEEAQRARQSQPGALIEDMESYSVAVAAHLAGCPLTVVRSVSNEAGVRDKKAWKIFDALEKLRLSLPPLLSAAQ